jgi:hypothetical protein
MYADQAADEQSVHLWWTYFTVPQLIAKNHNPKPVRWLLRTSDHSSLVSRHCRHQRQMLLPYYHKFLKKSIFTQLSEGAALLHSADRIAKMGRH